ncbi:MAG: DUF1298 domain-containing protein [Myxococcales bacterium]|nr:DUF1298 domain-containing protein [Myxococcales bacterium]
MSAVDAAWLRMDSAENPMIITALMLLDGQVEPSVLRDIVERRLLGFERFRQRAIDPSSPLVRPEWAEDPTFDVAHHVETVDGRSHPLGPAALADVVSGIMSSPLDRSRPLWKLSLVPGVILEDGRPLTALVARIHHAVADGVALVHVLMRLTDEGADVELPEIGVERGRPTSAHELWSRVSLDARSLLRMLILLPDERTMLKTPLTGRKRAAFSSAVSLDGVKAIARSTKSKVNDVLTAAIAGALRSAMGFASHWLEGPVRALVPVYVRGKEGLGNHFGLVYADLPVAAADPLERLHRARVAMQSAKDSPDAHVAVGVLGALGASQPLERLGIDIFTSKASMLITNVPGPPMAVHLGGHELVAPVVWAPVSGSLGLGFSLLSYAGTVRLGVATDESVPVAPSALVRAFEQEIELLASVASSP